MIDIKLRNLYIIAKKEKTTFEPPIIPLILNPNHTYWLETSLFNLEGGEENLECELIIKDINSNEIKRNFYKKDYFKFDVNDFPPIDDGLPDIVICNLTYLVKDFEKPKFLKFSLFSLYPNISDLKTSEQNKKNLLKLMDKFVKKDYEGVITDVGILGEHIATELYKKIKKNKKPKDFRTAVNSLVNISMSSRMKINYNYIGSLIWPIYYMRNEKSHPEPLIEFKWEEADICMRNLRKIIDVLSAANVKF